MPEPDDPAQADRAAAHACTCAAHPITPACPVDCLATRLSARTFNPLAHACDKRYGPGATIGHVIDLHLQDQLRAISGLGPHRTTQIAASLALCRPHRRRRPPASRARAWQRIGLRMTAMKDLDPARDEAGARLRLRRGMHLAVLADYCGVTVAFLSMVENGHRNHQRSSHVNALSDAPGTSPLYLAYGTPAGHRLTTTGRHDPGELLRYTAVDLTGRGLDEAMRSRDEFNFSVDIQFGEATITEVRLVSYPASSISGTLGHERATRILRGSRRTQRYRQDHHH